MALNNLLRFTEASVSRTTLFNDLVEYPVIREVLLAIFSQSQYLSDILVRDPGLFRWLTTTDVLHRPLNTETLRQEVRRIWEMFARPERRMDALRRLTGGRSSGSGPRTFSRKPRWNCSPASSQILQTC
jgi:glutamate-ammonia-ligase adenylyltransferase